MAILPERLQMFFSKVLYILLGIILPNRIKRLIFITGVYSTLVDRGVFHKETLAQLNRALCLARTAEALYLPPSVYQRVIDPTGVDNALRGIDGTGAVCMLPNEAKQVSAAITALAPPWLRYNDNKTMVKDVVSLLHCQPAFN